MDHVFRALRRRTRQPVELNIADAYARWASTYAANAHNPLMELEQRAMLDLLPGLSGLRVLDVACGSGRYLCHANERGAAQTIGIDVSPHMLKRARFVSPDLAQADLLSLPAASMSFDVIMCGLAVGHVEDLPRAVAEMSRVLKPDGVLVYSDFHPLGALLGWRRTFRADDGREYAVRHHIHLYADHHAACRAAGLIVEDVCEPRIDVEHAWRGYPAAIVIRARKAAHG